MMSLASAGEEVTYVFLGQNSGIDSVMSLATKRQMDQKPNVTILGLQDLVKYFKNHNPWHPILPSPLSLLKFYIGKKNPANILVDEAPLETTWWRILLTFSKSASLSRNKPLVANYVALLATFILSLICGLVSSQLLSSYYPCLISFMFVFLTITWLVVGNVTSSTSYYPTGLLLTSLPPFLGSSTSTLWIALQSNYIHDYGIAKSGSKKELEDWRKSLAPTFCCPVLRHNLRNSHLVPKVGFFTWDGAQANHAVDIANSSPPPPSLSPTIVSTPLFIPFSLLSNLPDAIFHAYEKLEKPTTLVILLDDKKMLNHVKKGLGQAGLTVATYLEAGDEAQCKSFLRDPVGALVTNGLLFSGMEAATIIWVKGFNPADRRSNILRAIDKLCIISRDLGQCKSMWGFQKDSTFAQCCLPWPSILIKCSCPGQPIICNTCSIVCHPHKREWTWSPTVVSLFRPFNNPCMCKASGVCKLPSLIDK